MYVAGCCGARDEKADYVAWGHSMLVDPWGKIVAGAEASETTLIADIGSRILYFVNKKLSTIIVKKFIFSIN